MRVELWDLVDQRLVLQSSAAGENHERSIEFSSDGCRFAYVAHDNSLVLYDITEGEEWKRIPIRYAPEFLCFSPKGDRVLVEWGSQVAILDVDTGEPSVMLGHSDLLADADWSPDGHFIATACHDTNVYLWDTDDVAEPWTVCRGHHGKARYVQFNARGDLLMSTAWDQTTRLWFPCQGRQLVQAESRGSMFSDDGCRLGFEVAGLTVGRWEVAQGEECRTLCGGVQGSTVVSLYFSPDGQRLASASRVDGIRVWDWATGETLAHVDIYDESRSVIITPDGEHLVTSGTGAIDRWPLEAIVAENTDRLGEIRETLHRGESRFPCEATLSQDGKRLFTSVAQEAFDVFDPDSPDDYERLSEKHNEDWFVALSPTGKWAASGGKHSFRVNVSDADTGELAFTVRPHESSGALVTFSPDGAWLVVSIPGQFILYEAGTWREVCRLTRDNPGFGKMAFSADMKLMAASDNFYVKLYDVEDFKLLAILPGPHQEQLTTSYPEGAGGLCFSPDGNLLAVGTMQNTIKLWDLKRIRSQLAHMGLDW